MAAKSTKRGHSREKGVFTFVEILLATLVLALAATATAYWVETVNNLATDADEQTVGMSIVKVMEGVIAPLAFRELGSTNFGPETGESLKDYDDIDDFHGLLSQPPLDGLLDPRTDLPHWSVEVMIEEVNPQTLEILADSDLRRIRVTATRKGRVVAEAWWLRARSPLE